MESIRELLEKKGYKRKEGNRYVEYSKSFYDCNGKEIFTISFSEYGEDSWIMFYSNTLFTTHDIIAATSNLKTYEEIKQEYNKFCSIPLFLINHEFYLSGASSLIWKGKFSDEQIEMKGINYNFWKCSIRDFTGKVVMKRIYSIKDLRCFLKNNEMLYYGI